MFNILNHNILDHVFWNTFWLIFSSIKWALSSHKKNPTQESANNSKYRRYQETIR